MHPFKNFKNTALLMSSLTLLTACTTLDSQSAQTQNTLTPKANIEAAVYLEGVAIVTDKMEESIVFYTEIMEFKVLRRKILDNEITRQIFSLNDNQMIDYASIFPIGATIENPAPGMHLAQIVTKDGAIVPLPKSQFTQSAERKPFLGDKVFAMEVRNIKKLAENMEAAGIVFLTPLKPSATGRSLTLNVLDPNGVRLQLYQYVEK